MGRSTVGGTADGANCCFPFIHNGEEQLECIRTGNKTEGAWCGTSDDYDVDKRWGYCQDDSSSGKAVVWQV